MRFGSAPTCSMMSISPSSGHFFMSTGSIQIAGQVPRRAGQLRADFIEAVGPPRALREDLRGGIFLAAPVGKLPGSSFSCRASIVRSPFATRRFSPAE